MLTVQIPSKNFVRRVICFRCRNITPHMCFFISKENIGNCDVYIFHQKCIVCEKTNTEYLNEGDTQSFILNKYL